jgi:hypothetical protein
MVCKASWRNQGARGEFGLAARPPRGRVVLGAEVGDQAGVDGVGLAAGQAGAGVGLDLRGVDDADHVPALGEELGGVLPVGVGRLHADMGVAAAVADQPVVEGGEALRGIRAGRVRALAAGQLQGAVQFGFADINAEVCVAHGENLKGSTLWMLAAGGAGPWILSDLGLRKGGGAKSTTRAWCP